MFGLGFETSDHIGRSCASYLQILSRLRFPLSISNAETVAVAEEFYVNGLFEDILSRVFGPVLTDESGDLFADAVPWIVRANEEPNGAQAEALFEFLAPGGPLLMFLSATSPVPEDFAERIQAMSSPELFINPSAAPPTSTTRRVLETSMAHFLFDTFLPFPLGLLPTASEQLSKLGSHPPNRGERDVSASRSITDWRELTPQDAPFLLALPIWRPPVRMATIEGEMVPSVFATPLAYLMLRMCNSFVELSGTDAVVAKLQPFEPHDIEQWIAHITNVVSTTVGNFLQGRRSAAHCEWPFFDRLFRAYAEYYGVCLYSERRRRNLANILSEGMMPTQSGPCQHIQRGNFEDLLYTVTLSAAAEEMWMRGHRPLREQHRRVEHDARKLSIALHSVPLVQALVDILPPPTFSQKQPMSIIQYLQFSPECISVRHAILTVRLLLTSLSHAHRVSSNEQHAILCLWGSLIFPNKTAIALKQNPRSEHRSGVEGVRHHSLPQIGMDELTPVQALMRTRYEAFSLILKDFFYCVSHSRLLPMMDAETTRLLMDILSYYRSPSVQSEAQAILSAQQRTPSHSWKSSPGMNVAHPLPYSPANQAAASVSLFQRVKNARLLAWDSVDALLPLPGTHSRDGPRTSWQTFVTNLLRSDEWQAGIGVDVPESQRYGITRGPPSASDIRLVELALRDIGDLGQGEILPREARGRNMATQFLAPSPSPERFYENYWKLHPQCLPVSSHKSVKVKRSQTLRRLQDDMDAPLFSSDEIPLVARVTRILDKCILRVRIWIALKITRELDPCPVCGHTLQLIASAEDIPVSTRGSHSPVRSSSSSRYSKDTFSEKTDWECSHCLYIVPPGDESPLLPHVHRSKFFSSNKSPRLQADVLGRSLSNEEGVTKKLGNALCFSCSMELPTPRTAQDLRRFVDIESGIVHCPRCASMPWKGSPLSVRFIARQNVFIICLFVTAVILFWYYGLTYA